jgi:hypothetical protein
MEKLQIYALVWGAAIVVVLLLPYGLWIIRGLDKAQLVQDHPTRGRVCVVE